MKKYFPFLFALLLANCQTTPIPTAAPGTRVAPTITAIAPTRALPSPTPASATNANRFGVNISGDNAARPEIVSAAKELGVAWVRLNVRLDGKDQDYTLFLKEGINVELTASHRDVNNADTKYGTTKQYPNAGFPFKDKVAYQQRVRALLQPALPYLAQGRQIYIQAENEIGDAAVNIDSRYWRGTTDQYLAQLAALSEAVKSVNPNISVALSSFASETLDALIEPNNPRREYAQTRVSKLLAQGQYDAVDLHFYGCVEDIGAKVKAVKEKMPAGNSFSWISTENGGPDSRCKTTPQSWKKNLQQFEMTQVAQVPARLSACAENGGGVCLWFSFLDLKNESDVFSHLGLLDQATNPPRKKAAYAAFKSFVAEQKK